MKKILLMAALLLLVSSAAQATYVSFDFTFDFDDSQGSNYFLQCIDAHTGVILFSEAPISSGKTYTMKIPKDNHDKVLCLVRVFGGPTVGFWRIFPKQYYQGCGGTVSADLPSDTGSCGDGAVTGPEKCDTGGNVGCSPSSAAPKCCRCEYCGCGSDKDCPQITQAQCGYGRCAPTERPIFTPTCYDCGTCIYPYRCQYDPNCDGKNNPTATKEAAFSIDQDSVQGALPPAQSGFFYLGGASVAVSYPVPLLMVNGAPLPEPPAAGDVFVQPDGTLVGILEADPTIAHFYLMDPGMLRAGVMEWQNSDIAIDKTGRENKSYLKDFLKRVLRNTPGARLSELINLTVTGDNKYKAVSSGKLISQIKAGSHCSPSLVVRTDKETLEDIFEDELTVAQAVAQGRVTVRLR